MSGGTSKARFQLPAARWDRLAISAVTGGAVVRIVWTFAVHPPVDYLFSDMGDYVGRAERLAAGGPLGPIDAFYPPGTHALLALVIRVAGDGRGGLWVASALWCALSIATVWMSWRLARELLTPSAAAITAALCGLSPIFITSGGFFMSETPSLAFLIAAMWSGVCATRRNGRARVTLALLSGALGGMAIATRPQLILNVAVLAIVLVVALRREHRWAIAGFGAGVLVFVSLAIVHNSVAAGQFTGLATNGGMNFWFGHCDARELLTFDDDGERTAWYRPSVPNLAGRGGNFEYRGIDTWDEDFFYDLGWECIENDGPAHVARLARNVVDMTATTAPWPQAEDRGWARELPRAGNFLYAVLLPWIVIESCFLVARRRRDRQHFGAAFLLANLLCVVPVAILIMGDPRVRSVYDVFGIALLGALLADRFRLDAFASTDDSGPDDADARSVPPTTS